MKITKKDLIFLLLIVLSFYLNRRPVEKLVNISKDSAGNYVIPGNLKIKGGLNVTKITPNGKLVVPGGLEVEGSLSVNGSTVLNGKTDFKGQSVFNKTMHIKGPKGTSYLNFPDGNIYLRGNVHIDQPGANNLTVLGNTTIRGNTTVRGKNVMVIE